MGEADIQALRTVILDAINRPTGGSDQILAANQALEELVVQARSPRDIQKRWTQLSMSPDALEAWGLAETTHAQRGMIREWLGTWIRPDEDPQP